MTTDGATKLPKEQTEEAILNAKLVDLIMDSRKSSKSKAVLEQIRTIITTIVPLGKAIGSAGSFFAIWRVWG